MAQSLSKIIIHIIFSTKNRYPFINARIRDELHKYLAGICKNLGCFVHIINSSTDHVHIVCELHRTLPVSKLLEEIKKSSSRWLKTKGGILSKFSWQNGYGAFSVGKSQLPIVINYVRNQEQHHRKKSFREEFLLFLKKYDVDYDEKYLWD